MPTEKGHSQQSGFRTFLKFTYKHTARLTLCMNLLCLLWLWGCCITTWIPNDAHPRIAMLNITFPVALIVNILFIFVWIVLQFRKVWIPLLGTLVCWGYIMDYVPINPSADIPNSALKIVSWNTMGMGGKENHEEAKDYLKNCDADIICLQESDLKGSAWEDFINEMKERGYEHDNHKGQCLLTRYHVLESDTMLYETRTNSSSWYRVLRDQDTLLIINNHLESNHIPMETRDEYAEVLDNPEYSKAKQSGRSIVSNMIESGRYRSLQAQAMRDFIKENERNHIIVCGDFNDTPISYAYQTISRCLKNAYRDSGNGFSVSYNKKGFWVRIDHIFFSAEGESYRTFIDHSISVSDHFPIVSWLKF